MPDLFSFENLYHALDNERIIRESAAVMAGQILAIQGPSGSGKSTLLKMLARLLPSESGKVFLTGHIWTEYTPQEWRVKIHYYPQYPVLFAGSVLGNLQMPFTLRQVQSTAFNLEDAFTLLDELGLPRSIMDQEARTLSGGEAARLALIRSLLIQPTILLLDEPTAHLDKDSAGWVLKLLNKWIKSEPERAVIIVTHNAEDLNEFNDITVLHLGSRIEENKHE